MKSKIFMILFVLISVPTFADTQQIDIAPGANVLCNAALLGTTSGTVRLRANFVPEDIDLKWYDGNNQVNVANASNTCTYDTAINLPTNPTREGYEFKGWKVIPQYDFSTLDTTIGGLHRYGHVITATNNDVCVYDGSPITCDSVEFTELGRHQWKVTFNYGTIYGDAMCSTVSGSYAVAGNPMNDGGINCWCKVTGYKNGNIWYSPASSLSWIYFSIPGSTYTCARYCATNCAYDIQNVAGFRRALFGQSSS